MQRAPFQIVPVDVGDLQLAARAGLQAGGDGDHVVVVEIEAGDRPVGTGAGGLLLDRGRPPGAVEGDDAVTPGVGNAMAEHRRPGPSGGGAAQLAGEAAAVEDVVAQGEGAAIVADEVAPDQEGLGQALGAGLHAVADGHPPAAAVAQKPPEGFAVAGRGDRQDLPDARQHQRGERVIDHGLVVDRQQLLVHRAGRRAQAGVLAAGQQNALHRAPFRRRAAR